jgi:hypothetical protein
LGEFDEPQALLGDVDDNGSVNIGDVTALINILLSGLEPESIAAADVNQDGHLTIDDVTKLINFLLSGNW